MRLGANLQVASTAPSLGMVADTRLVAVGLTHWLELLLHKGVVQLLESAIRSSESLRLEVLASLRVRLKQLSLSVHLLSLSMQLV